MFFLVSLWQDTPVVYTWYPYDSLVSQLYHFSLYLRSPFGLSGRTEITGGVLKQVYIDLSPSPDT